MEFDNLGFSIIVPVKEINNYIIEAAAPLAKLDYHDYEVIILPNEEPSAIPHELQNKHTRIIPTGRVSPAVKRDMGAKESQFEILAFLDDDAYPDQDWLITASKLFAKHRVDGLCGPAITPSNSPVSEKASGLFFETLVGGGGMDYRYRQGARDLFFVDDYPTVNLMVTKKSFFEVGGFDSNYWPGEDTKFCLDFVNSGHKILYSRDLIVWHHRRKVFLPHLNQVRNYGLHRGYFARVFPKTSARLVYFCPSLFLVGHIGLIFLMVYGTLFWPVIPVLASIYLGVLTIDVFLRTKNLKVGLLTIPTIYISHLVYGFMFLKGILHFRKLESKLR